MRRAFVILLILLFPLNVFALSMSASSVQQANAIEHVMASVEDSSDRGAGVELALGELDPDEPPSSLDPHDSVHARGPLPAALPSGGSVLAPLPLRHGLAPFPPIKPPPVR